MLANILILLLASCSVFLALRYIFALKENIVSLRNNPSILENQKQNLLQDLEKEKNALQQVKAKNIGLRVYLKSAHQRLNHSLEALNQAEEKMDKLGAQLAILKAENSALLEDREKLTRENEAMKEGKDSQPSSSAKIKIEVRPVSR